MGRPSRVSVVASAVWVLLALVSANRVGATRLEPTGAAWSTAEPRPDQPSILRWEGRTDEAILRPAVGRRLGRWRRDARRQPAPQHISPPGVSVTGRARAASDAALIGRVVVQPGGDPILRGPPLAVAG